MDMTKNTTIIYRIALDLLQKGITVNVMSLDEIISILDLGEISFYNLKSKILNPIIQEINIQTDLNFMYETIKEGKSYKYIKFYFIYKNDSKSDLDLDWKKIVINSQESNRK